MKTRSLWLCLMLLGCPDEKKKPDEHAATPVAAAPDAAAAVAAPVITKNVVPEPQPPPQAEVEFFGEIDLGKVKAERVVFVVTKAPFEATSEELELLEQTDVNAGKLFTEFFFDQGTVGYLYALAYDAKGQLVGFAAHGKNPVTFQGEGEVEVKDVVLKLKGVKARAAPKGM